MSASMRALGAILRSTAWSPLRFCNVRFGAYAVFTFPATSGRDRASRRDPQRRSCGRCRALPPRPLLKPHHSGDIPPRRCSAPPLHCHPASPFQLGEPVPTTDQSPPDSAAPSLRVCHIISSFHPVIAGAERATQSLVKALRQRDHDVVVITRRYSRDLPGLERIDGVPVYRLGWPGRGKLNALTFGVHALAILAWRLREYGLIHVQNIDAPLLIGLLARALLRRQLVVTIHGHTPIMGRNTSFRGRLRTRLMAHAVDRFTSINPDNTAVLVDLGVPREHIHEIPNGIDTTIFRPPGPADRNAARSQLGLAADEFVVVYIGRLIAWKRVDLLIDAWSRSEPVNRGRLLIVGDGPEGAALRAAAERVGPDVRMEGSSDCARLVSLGYRRFRQRLGQ